MYKVEWDEEINGILLVNSSNHEIIPPRPVFYEELDLLGFNKYWDYPKTEEPLLWNIGRRYFYKGELVAEVRGGNIFEEPKVKITEKGKNLVLEPINIKSLVEKNQEALKTLENEAIDFINETYNKYKNKVDYFVVSYSGGKDSQVVLDLVSRTIPPDEFMVIFTDTTMEIPPTYEIFEKTKEYYTRLYPNLKFFMVRNEQHSYDLWKIFGPPSRIIRWCCSVYKTSPQVRFLRRLNPDKPNLKILVFDGVRAEESARRSEYSRIAEEVKHLTVVNARPIINWLVPEIFIYLYYRELKYNNKLILNDGYRLGLSRVGCSICPFGSFWSEFIINKTYPNIAEEYVNIIKNYAKNVGLDNEEDIKTYLIKGNWKKRAGGRGVDSDINVILTQKDSVLKAIVISKNDVKNFLTWSKVLGKVFVGSMNNGIIEGEILTEKKSYRYMITNNHDKKVFEINNVDQEDRGIIKKIINKTAYCIGCGVCEAECKSGALRVIPELMINSNKCKNCLNCLNFNDYGCHLLKSLYTSKEVNMGNIKGTKTSSIDRYSTFGIREQWLKDIFRLGNSWFVENRLGNKQFDAMVNWMKEAQILERQKNNINFSNLFRILSKIFDKESLLAWEIIWINLFYNSVIVKWYLQEISWGMKYSKKELHSLLKESFPNLSDGTLKNPLDALANTFENSPLGDELKIGFIEKSGRERIVKKIGTDDVHPLAVLYSLYRYAISKNRYRFTVSELYREDNKDGGPYLLFGISRSALESILRWLSDKYREYIYVEIVADLDNISLSEDIKNYVKLLEELWKK